MATPSTRRLMLGALTVELAVLVYVNALQNPFVYDDLVGVVRNPALVEGQGILALIRGNLFRPIVSLSFAVDHALWGLWSVGYHLINLLLHALNTALLFILAQRAVADWNARNPGVDRDADVASVVAAGLFAVHPLMSEAVGYVSGRPEVLAATFVLLSCLALRAGLTRPGWRPLGVALALAGAATKEVAIALPVVLLAGDRLLLDGDASARRRRLLRWHVPFVAAAAALGVARAASFIWIERGHVSQAALTQAETKLRVAWRFLILLVAPVRQSIVHSVGPVTAPVDGRALVAATGLIAVGVLAWRFRRRQPLIVFGAVWFFAFLAPAMAVALFEPMAERRVYIAGAGFFLAVAAAAAEGWARLGRRSRLATVGAFALVMATLGVLTIARNQVWRDAVTLWRDAARKAPGEWRAHFGLANALGEQGRCLDALPEYETALRLSAQPETYTNYGVCLAAQRRLPEAAAAFERAVALDPNSAMAHHNLGLMALHAGNLEGAHAHFLRAISMHARDAWWRQTLMRIYELEIRDPDKTLELCRAIVRVAGRETPGALACLERLERRAGRSP